MTANKKINNINIYTRKKMVQNYRVGLTLILH